jgi:hypothetical protein
VVVIHTTATPFLGRLTCMTMSVQQLPVVSRLLLTLTFENNMIDLDRVILGELQSTGTTSALLWFQQPGYLRFALGRASHSCAPIGPVAVIRTPCTVHFHVAPVWRVGMREESCPTVGRLKGPTLSLIHAPVLACDWVFGGVRMSVDCPAPQHRIARVVQLLEEARAPDGSLVLAPATDLRMQALLRRRLVARDGLPEGVNIPLDGD